MLSEESHHYVPKLGSWPPFSPAHWIGWAFDLMRKFAYVLQGANSRPDIEPAGAKAETAIGRPTHLAAHSELKRWLDTL